MSKAPQLFDYVKDLSYGKEGLLYQEETNHTSYSPYMVNRAFSFGVDTIFWANEINKHPNTAKELHHDFYFYSLSKKKRYNKWPKASKTNNIELIMEYLNCNEIKAKEALKILTDEQVQEIMKLMDTGGRR